MTHLKERKEQWLMISAFSQDEETGPLPIRIGKFRGWGECMWTVQGCTRTVQECMKTIQECIWTVQKCIKTVLGCIRTAQECIRIVLSTCRPS